MAGFPNNQRLPYGRGHRRGEEAVINQTESQSLRQNLIPSSELWCVSSLGMGYYGHSDVTGVLSVANQLNLIYIPERTSTLVATSARISVAVGVAASYFRAALFSYTPLPVQQFTVIAGSECVWNTASTGIKTVSLFQGIRIPPDVRLFMGWWCNSATVAVEGVQSGTVVTGRPIRVKTRSGVTPPFNSYYLNTTSTSATIDVPFITYLSRDAQDVL